MRNDVSMTFEQLEDEWQRKVQGMYNGGLDTVVKAAEAAKMNERMRAANLPTEPPPPPAVPTPPPELPTPPPPVSAAAPNNTAPA